GQYLAVDVDTGQLHTVHELRVGKPMFPNTGVDPLDPQAAEVTLLVAAVAIGVAQRLLDLFQRHPVGGAAAPAIPLGEPQHLLVPGMRRDPAFDPGHRSALSRAYMAYRSAPACCRPSPS